MLPSDTSGLKWDSKQEEQTQASTRPCRRDRHDRHQNPEHDASDLRAAEPLRRSAVQGVSLGVCHSAPHSSSPPLPEPHHGRVVQRHGNIKALYLVACGSEAKTQLRFLSSDDCWIEPSDLIERRRRCHEDPTARANFSWLARELNVTQPVVDGSLRVPLSDAPANDGHARLCSENIGSRLQPSGNDLAVPIDELYKLNAWIRCTHPLESFIPSPGCAQRTRLVETNHGDAHLRHRFRTAVR